MKPLSSILVSGFAAILVWASPSMAQEGDKLRALYNAMLLPDYLQVVRVEGLGYGEEISEDLFQRPASRQWMDLVETLYDFDRMEASFLDAFAGRIDPDELDALIGYFTTDTGRKIASLELEARREFLDEENEIEAQVLVEYMRSEADPRLSLLDELTEAGHFIDLNVAGTLNSNYAFFYGLIDSGGLAVEMTEDDVLAEVWSQEPKIREEIELWLTAYQVVAYHELPDEALRDYIAFYESDAGRRLNTALFDSFDVLFSQLSRGLGVAAGQLLTADEI